MALCDVFHFTVHSRRLLCSSSLRQGASEPETVVEIFVHVGRVCAVLCPHHTRPKQLCSVSMPYIDASIELCNVTCCFICCAGKDSCVQSIPASSGPGTWSHNLEHSQDEFNFQETLDIAGSPMQEQRMCSLTSVAKLYCGSLLPTAESKDLRRTQPANLAPPRGRERDLLSRRKARERHGIAKSVLASDTANASLACHNS